MRNDRICIAVKGHFQMAAGLTSSYSLSYGGNAECRVTLTLFTDVTNSAQLKEQASTGLIPAALLNTALVSIEYIMLCVGMVKMAGCLSS